MFEWFRKKKQQKEEKSLVTNVHKEDIIKKVKKPKYEIGDLIEATHKNYNTKSYHYIKKIIKSCDRGANKFEVYLCGTKCSGHTYHMIPPLDWECLEMNKFATDMMIYSFRLINN